MPTEKKKNLLIGRNQEKLRQGGVVVSYGLIYQSSRPSLANSQVAKLHKLSDPLIG